MDEYRAVLRAWADIRGRTSRRAFWTYLLVTVLIGLGVSFVGAAVGVLVPLADHLGAIYALFVAVPTATAAIRRLHDGSYSGALVFVGLVPFVGRVVLAVLLARRGDEGENRHGPAPTV